MTIRRPLLILAVAGLALLAAVALALAAAPRPAAYAGPARAGDVRFVKHMKPSDDRFFADAANRRWIRAHFDVAMVFRPFFDRHRDWYRRGWLYKDAYAIYPGGRDARRHPEWILRDRRGRRLFIPWGCDPRCPQYAADVGDPRWRQQWIAEARASLARGYRGVWIDDVNLEFRVADRDGDRVVPMDDRTGRPMTYAAWRRYMAEFMEQVRRELPRARLVHNSIWYAGTGVGRWRDPFVRRQVAAADWINLERGAADRGLTGGSGSFSLRRLFEFVDFAHERGASVVYDQTSVPRPSSLEFNLAAYFLTSAGADGVSAPRQRRRTWWRGFDVSLGPPRGPRYEHRGLIRRDFARGLVLLNEPGAPTRTVRLPRPMRTTAGRVVERVTLGGRRAAVLRRP